MSVKLKSPFRYPGGKSKLSDQIVGVIKKEFGNPHQFTFVDVFAGGGSVSLKVAEEFPKAEIVLNDLDEWIYSFWNSLNDEKECKRLLQYVQKHHKPTVEDFNALRQACTRKGLKKGYKGFIGLFFNRTAFSGIFGSGPIGGYDQTGKYKIDCRYNPERMKHLIKNIAQDFKSRKVTVTQKDFRAVIKKYGDDSNAVLYLDPPYMKEGKTLYNHFMQPEEYEEMAQMIRESKCHWIISHNDNPDFIGLYEDWADITNIEGVPYTINSIKGKKRVELLVTPMTEKKLKRRAENEKVVKIQTTNNDKEKNDLLEEVYNDKKPIMERFADKYYYLMNGPKEDMVSELTVVFLKACLNYKIEKMMDFHSYLMVAFNYKIQSLCHRRRA